LHIVNSTVAVVLSVNDDVGNPVTMMMLMMMMRMSVQYLYCRLRTKSFSKAEGTPEMEREGCAEVQASQFKFSSCNAFTAR